MNEGDAGYWGKGSLEGEEGKKEEVGLESWKHRWGALFLWLLLSCVVLWNKPCTFTANYTAHVFHLLLLLLGMAIL